jgi:hypothetical protein
MSPAGQDKPRSELVGEDILIRVATRSPDGDALTKLHIYKEKDSNEWFLSQKLHFKPT